MRFQRNAKIFRGQLDAAPFVGVFFLLVIFLVLQSSLVFVPGVKVQLDLPEANVFSGTTNPTVVVVVDRGGSMYYGNQVVTEPELRGQLKSEVKKYRDLGAELTLVVQMDRAVSYETVVELVKVAKEVGVKEVLQAVRPALVPASSSPPIPVTTNK